MEPVRKLGLPLFDAICAWCDPHLIPEFRQLTVEEFDDDLTGFLVGDGPKRWKVFRYAELRDQLVGELRKKLFGQMLTATGFDARAPIAPPVELPAELWPLLTLNLRESSATFDEVKIIGIRVAESDRAESIALVESNPAAAFEAAWLASPMSPTTAFMPVRLLIKVEGRQVSFDGKRLLPPLAARPFAVFRILAEAARDGTGPVSKTAIYDRLMSKNTLDSAVKDAVRDLRQGLKMLGISDLVQTRSNVGYLLNLRSAEIEIQP